MNADHDIVSLAERLMMLKARDVMAREPVVLTADASLSDAVATLERHAITGCPVVDRRGQLIGMLSLWDIARAKEKSPALAENAACSQSSEDVSAGDATVKDRMSHNVGTVSETQSLVEVAHDVSRTLAPASRCWQQSTIEGHYLHDGCVGGAGERIRRIGIGARAPSLK